MSAGLTARTRDVPVYLLHGLLGTASAHFCRQLGSWRRDRVVRGIDLPGHGTSPAAAERPYWAGAVREVVRRLERYGPGDLVAVSYLGGTVAVRVAAAAPQLVRSLVLAGFVPDVPHAALTSWVAAFAPLADAEPEIAAEYERLHGRRWRRTLQVVAEEIENDYEASVRVPVTMLAGLVPPTLLLNGARRGDERDAAARLPVRPGALDVGLVPGAGHMVQYEAADVFNILVERFWAGLDADAVADADAEAGRRAGAGRQEAADAAVR